MRANEVGRRYGRLVAVERAGQDRWKAALWRFRCDCGNENYVARIDQVRRGVIQSCGCLNAERSAERARNRMKHGHSPKGARSPEYRAWRAMMDRCTQPSNPSFKNYGGRGITVCDPWRSFETFLLDMGPKPAPNCSVGRRDGNGNYEPSNCRWESGKQQARNTSRNRMVTFLGREMTLAEACELRHISRNVVDARLRRGWTPERAITTPVKVHRPRGAESVMRRRRVPASGRAA